MTNPLQPYFLKLYQFFLLKQMYLEHLVEFLPLHSVLALETAVGSTPALRFFKAKRASEIIFRLLFRFWKLSPIKNYHNGAEASRRIVRYTSYATMFHFLQMYGNVNVKSIVWEYFKVFRDLPPLEEA